MIKDRINKSDYNRLKNKAENALRSYPYYLISFETPGLGNATRWDVVKAHGNTLVSVTENAVLEEEYKRNVVNAIDYVYDRLDDLSKKVIDLYYYRDNYTIVEIQDQLKIDRNKFYRLRKNALDKFIIVLANV